MDEMKDVLDVVSKNIDENGHATFNEKTIKMITTITAKFNMN
ncbi:hypothetical protein [Methanobrevibacter millerae]|uniref:Uncharacterized protein n=1 Tax=Methanobrevibacter millerae TaxID=230361 RepID=A0A1G5XB83_9EURY|nr:hypothetical protein [Methanobrevibacter millerae]SDA67522.1 hypothetical protein SAMN02910315_02093 [Methanobrevibacter millerae]